MQGRHFEDALGCINFEPLRGLEMVNAAESYDWFGLCTLSLQQLQAK